MSEPSSGGGPAAHDPIVPDSERTVRGTTETRQGRPAGMVRRVLVLGLVLVVLGFAVAYLFGRP